jgi:hypothetical protein
VELVLYPHEVELIPGQPWVKRLKYLTVAELLSDYEAATVIYGIAHCPVRDWLAQNLDMPLDQAEAYIYGHPQWGPVALCETAYKTLRFNNLTSHPHGEHIAKSVQNFCMLEVSKHNWNDARYAFSEMLKCDEMIFVSPEAAYVALAYLNKNHPNPRKFLEKTEVREKFKPFGVVISRFSSPDFEEVA